MHVKASVIAVLFMNCSATLAGDTPVDFSGYWWSNRCGQVILVEQGNRLEGQYIPSSGPQSGQRLPLTGFRSGGDLISFVVNFGINGPITAWAGQHIVQENIENIVTQWHMTIDVPDEEEEADLYKSIWTGADIFVRSKPGHCK
jgi:hypothetical protein